MTQTEPQQEAVVDQAAYDAVAIAIAEKVAVARRANRERIRDADPSPDQLFHDRNRVGLGVAREWEAMGRRHVSEDLQRRADAIGARFEHLAPTIGTVIHGVDLRPPHDPELIDFIRATLLERKVVGFRDQQIDDDDQEAFARCFGDADPFPFSPPGDNPYLAEIHHDRSSPGTENGWHTDVTWMERPSMGSVARLVEQPSIGGDTLFADSYAAFAGLPVALQERLATVEGINDYRYLVLGLPEDLVEEIKARIPYGVSHPLARTHPETGRTALYLNGAFLRPDSLHDVRTGEALPDSRQVVQELLAQHARPELQCRFRWEPGSVAFWDNRAVQHYAANDYWPERRTLHRVTIAGDRPFHRPAG